MTATAMRGIVAAAVLAALPVMSPPAVAQAPAGAGAAAGRQLARLALPHRRFTLPNGLRVVVRTDRKAPVVAVSVLYAVGSKHEPAGRAGFAHLFEHLMFSGSANAPGNYLTRVAALGGGDVNGRTGQDSTIFFQTVPTAALDRVLFLEADRMGHLAGTIDRTVLDVNRAIVRNEKRQGESQPGAAAADRVLARLFPPGHPHGHSVIGSMKTLDAATVDDVRDWHRRYYSPDNAVLVLTGDVDAKVARRLVRRHFGDLARGTAIVAPAASVPTLPAPFADTLVDAVTSTQITRHWAIPGLEKPDGIALDVAAKILGTLSGRWLTEVLVRRERLASWVIAAGGGSNDVGTFIIGYAVAPGVDPRRLAARLDALLEEFLVSGPSEEDVRRVAMREIGWRTLALETGAGQATTMAAGVLAADDPLHFRVTLARMAALDAGTVRDAASRWLRRPAYTLTVEPGPASVDHPATIRSTTPPLARSPVTPAASFRPLPPIGPAVPFRFPAVERFRLANGIPVIHVRQRGTPITRIAMTLDAGAALDTAGPAGAQDLLLATLPDGSAGLDAQAMAVARETLGADWAFESGDDVTTASLTVPSGGLAPATRLFADMIRRPALPEEALADRRTQVADLLRQRSRDPAQVAERTMVGLLYGPTSPYAARAGADPATIAAVTRDGLVALHRAWFRPEKATLFVVSDLPAGTIRKTMDRMFGDWKGVGQAGSKVVHAATPATPQIVLVDHPGSSQAVILAAVPTSRDSFADLEALEVAADALGGARGRINLNLRERHGWSYGAGGSLRMRESARSYIVRAPVQTDRAGAAMAEIFRDLSGFVGERPLDASEFEQVLTGIKARWPGRFERGDTVMSMIRANVALGQPVDHQSTLPGRYAELDKKDVVRAAREAFDPARLIWVVVGDAAVIRPQLSEAWQQRILSERASSGAAMMKKNELLSVR